MQMPNLALVEKKNGLQCSQTLTLLKLCDQTIIQVDPKIYFTPSKTMHLYAENIFLRLAKAWALSGIQNCLNYSNFWDYPLSIPRLLKSKRENKYPNYI
jgi:hypothetical protein